MSTFLLILTAFATFHFIYEGVILPSIRLKLRYELFSLRDKLRLLRGDNKDKIQQELFSYLQAGINNTIKLLPIINIELFIRAKRAVENDPDFQQRIEKRLALLNSCSIPEVEEIKHKTYQLMGCAFIANGGAWLVYLVPIFIVMSCFNMLKEWVKRIASISEAEINKIVSVYSLTPTYA